MNSSGPDFQKLYKTQDQVILVLKEVLDGFYLTGGTALGRYFLDHRYSEDLDFFVNADADFSKKLNKIYRKLHGAFSLDEELNLIVDSYARLYILGDCKLKIDLVNDVPEHWGDLLNCDGFMIDNPANILSNKLCAILNRDEPKDVFDIVSIACAYSFNWKEVYYQAGRKQLINETDIAMRLSSFPVELLTNQLWLKEYPDHHDFAKKINVISNDLLFGRENSLGFDKVALEKASVNVTFI